MTDMTARLMAFCVINFFWTDIVNEAQALKLQVYWSAICMNL